MRDIGEIEGEDGPGLPARKSVSDSMEQCIIEPFEPRRFVPVSGLLADVRRQRRKECPLLPAGLDDPDTARRILDAKLGGMTAVAPDGRLKGFLFAETTDDPLWGSIVTSGIDAWALAPGEGAASLARLYAAAFGPHVAASRAHRVYCPAFDEEALKAWFPMARDPVDGRSDGGIELSVGATVPEERGKGVGRALTARGLSEARRQGYTSCFADWRTTNPLASAFWPTRGFKPYAYRLVRRIEPAA